MKYSTRRIYAFFLWALILGFGVSGCVYLKELIGLGTRPPEARLKHVMVTKLALSSIDLQLIINVRNPNSFNINLNRMDYKATSSEEEIAEGRYDQSLVIPGDGEVDVDIPLKVNTGAVIRLLEKYLKNPKGIKILVDGVINFKTPLGDMDIEFKEEKKIEKHP